MYLWLGADDAASLHVAEFCQPVAQQAVTPPCCPLTHAGFVWDKRGHVVTNYHVIRGASDVLVSFFPAYIQHSPSALQQGTHTPLKLGCSGLAGAASNRADLAASAVATEERKRLSHPSDFVLANALA